MTDFPRILALLRHGGVEFIVIGGVAATAHGAARATYDVDVLYHRTDENIRRIVSVLAGHDPYPRGAPRGLPFIWDERTIQMGLNFTLTTDLGDIDLLGEIAGGGYQELLRDCDEIIVHREKCLCLKLEKLIEVKRAAGRPKDFEAIAELEALLEERNKQQDDQTTTLGE
jgi:predicted nucleotidyltransferase